MKTPTTTKNEDDNSLQTLIKRNLQTVAFKKRMNAQKQRERLIKNNIQIYMNNIEKDLNDKI